MLAHHDAAPLERRVPRFEPVGYGGLLVSTPEWLAVGADAMVDADRAYLGTHAQRPGTDDDSTGCFSW